MWLYVPSDSSQDAADSTSPSNSQPNTSDWDKLARSVTLNGKSPQPRFLRRALQTDRFRPLQFGRMSQPSMDADFEAWLTSFTADFHAPICPSPGGKPGSQVKPPASGSSTSASFAKFNHGTCSLRTSQASLWEMPDEPYLENLPASGSMRTGSLFERPTWVPRTSGSGCSSSPETWRTPAAGNPANGGSQDPAKRLAGGHTVDLQDQAEYWATPATRDWESGEASDATYESNARPLNEEVLRWPTPDANTASYSNGKFGMNLREASATWPTPRCEDSEACGNHPGATDSLTGATRNWPTPRVTTNNGIGQPGRGEQSRLVMDFPSSHPAPATSQRGEPYFPRRHSLRRLIRASASSARARLLLDSLTYRHWSWGRKRLVNSWQRPSERRRLNADFVSWLMGWPPLWTSARHASEPEETALYRSRALRLLSSFFGDTSE